MGLTPYLSQQTLRLTLFTHAKCSLCHDVKSTMSKVWQRRPFAYEEVDILAQENSKWRSLYLNDIPVVHIDQVRPNGTVQDQSRLRKLKHRFTEADLERTMDLVEKN